MARFRTLRIIEVVGIVFSAHSLGSEVVLEGLAHLASLAASGLTCAVNGLLNRERGQAALLHGIGTFESTDCGEGPTSTALALVDDIRNKSLLSPVDGVRNSLVDSLRETRFVLGLLFFRLSPAECALVLILCPIAKFIMGDFERLLIISSHALDQIIVQLPLLEALLQLLLGDVALAVLGAVLQKPIKVTVLKLFLHESADVLGDGLILLLVRLEIGIVRSVGAMGVLGVCMFILVVDVVLRVAMLPMVLAIMVLLVVVRNLIVIEVEIGRSFTSVVESNGLVRLVEFTHGVSCTHNLTIGQPSKRTLMASVGKTAVWLGDVTRVSLVRTIIAMVFVPSACSRSDQKADAIFLHNRYIFCIISSKLPK